MRRFISIKNKLLLLLLVSIALILLLIGLSLGYLIEQYFERNAQQDFARFYGELSEQLLLKEENLKTQGQRLARRSDVVSSINMLSRYASAENYRPLVYDSEKRNLAQSFYNEARAAGIDQIVAYDSDGELIAYYSLATEASMGYLSYEEGQPRTIVTRSDVYDALSWHDGELPGELESRYETSLHRDAARYRSFEQGMVIEHVTPVYRTFADGNRATVGYIKVKKLLGAEFINGLSDKTGIHGSLITDAGKRFGRLDDIDTDMLGPIETVSVVDHHLPFRHYNLTGYFAAAVAIELSDSGRAIVLAGLPKSVVEQAVDETFSAVLLVLLFSAALILPLGIVVSRRTFSQPLAKLLTGVEALQRGEYGVQVALKGNDELSTVALAFNDMSESIRERENRLVESEERYRSLVDNLPQRVFLKDRNLNYLSCNSRYAKDHDLTPSGIIGKNDTDLYSRKLAEEYRHNDERVLNSGRIEEFEEPYIINDELRIVQAVKSPVRGADNQVTGLLGIFWDITEKKLADEKLRQSAVVFESTADGVMITDAQNRIIAVNKAFSDITGYSEAETLGNTPSFRRSERQTAGFYEQMWQELAQHGRWQGEIWNRRKSGDVYPEWMTISVVLDESGVVSNYVSVFSDITNVKQSQMQLDHMAHHDPLTDLPNRTLLADRLSQAIHRAERNGLSVAVLFIDLDRFKNVNDTLGHPSGDLLLQEVARRLQHLLRQEDTVARLGGDEFIVVVEDVERPDFAESIASKIIETIARPFTIHGEELFIGASIGISLYPADDSSPANLIQFADTAMYRAKEVGRNTYQFYTQELTDSVVERLAMESSLRRAIENDQLELCFQPQVELQSGKIIGAEALLRWHHPELGRVSPEKFIPLAEEAGLILPIGEWVLRHACIQAAEWCRDFPGFRRVAVNLSIAQLERSDFVDTVSTVLAESGLSAERLELEITEGMLMQSPDISQMVLCRLRDLGLELAIDDFGTGYSSLSYLKRFPIQSLKIDRSFIMDIPQDPNDEAITRAVIALGKSLQLQIVAEGVETEEQVEFLRREGCQLAQGYFYRHAISAEEMSRLLVIGHLPCQTD